MSTTVKPPYDIFLDTTGKPLDNGRIYIGEINANPETTPILVYYDRAQTIPAPNPVTTIGGYPSRAGSAASLFVSGGYSILVKDKNGVVVFHSATNSDDSADGQAIQIKNYFDNSTFETGTTTGWNLGKDSGTTTPLSGGIGGGATDFLPLSINGSTPLAGGNSLLLNKATGNAQGSTLYTDNMTVELEDVGAEMYIGFSYITPSVGYTTGDLSAFLWDVTGGALVTLSSNAVPVSAGVAAKFTASATLPAGRTTFRFILMFTNAANLAEISIELDSFAFSPYTFADAATTGYVDAAVAAHAALTNPHSATSAATASRLMLRDASGNVSVNQLTSVVATGTAPFVVASTTKVTNLNADLLDDKSVGTSGNVIPLLDGANTWSGVQTFNSIPVFNGGTSGASSPFTVDSTFLVTNLNSQYLSGFPIGQSGSSYIPYANANGNFLVGTTSEWSKISFDGRMTLHSTTGNVFELYANSTSVGGDKTLSTGYAGRIEFIASVGDWVLQTTPSQSAGAAIASFDSRFTLKNDGTLLAGTTTNVYGKIQTVGLGQTTGAWSDSGNSGSDIFVSASDSAAGAGGAILLGATVTNGRRAQGMIKSLLGSGAGNGVSDMVFSMRASTANTALTEWMRLTAGGKFFVNRSTDDGSGAVLQVNGGISATGLVRDGTNTIKIANASKSLRTIMVALLNTMKTETPLSVPYQTAMDAYIADFVALLTT